MRRALESRKFGRWGCFWAALGAWLLCTSLIALLPFVRRLEGQPGAGPGGGLPTPAAVNPNDFYSRVYARALVGEVYPQPAADPLAAGQMVGFSLLTPGSLPAGMPRPPRVGMNSPHGYRVRVDLATARELLNLAGLPVTALPPETAAVDTLVTVQPVASLHSEAGAAWFTLLQGRRPLAGLPEGIDPATFDRLGELGLRYLGVPEGEAAALAARLGWTWFLAFPPGDLLRGESTPVRGASGLALTSTRPGDDRAALVWEAGDVIYAVYGGLPLEELRRLAEGLE
jgi:hypothetical protein